MSARSPDSRHPDAADDQKFDDIPTTSGLGSTPSIYHHLVFSKYNVLTPHDPELDGIISPNDLNCAVSGPNAIVGSRTLSSSDLSPNSDGNTPQGAYFSIANSSSMIDRGLRPYISLLSFNIKPMDAPPPWTTVTVTGYSHARNKSDPYIWGVDFPAGFHLPFLVKIQEYSREAWDQLYGVEISADFGEQKLDWEFCLDDLEVQFFKLNGSVKLMDGPNSDQIVLHEQ